ncbi:hypothetical protein HDV05_006134 [Chytridiales sp. JEL 0842]|nr:hypothetical protein HDV05_006134 [Chytridiales sp. JEL 0842]
MATSFMDTFSFATFQQQEQQQSSSSSSSTNSPSLSALSQFIHTDPMLYSQNTNNSNTQSMIAESPIHSPPQPSFSQKQSSASPHLQHISQQQVSSPSAFNINSTNNASNSVPVTPLSPSFPAALDALSVTSSSTPPSTASSFSLNHPFSNYSHLNTNFLASGMGMMDDASYMGMNLGMNVNGMGGIGGLVGHGMPTMMPTNLLHVGDPIHDALMTLHEFNHALNFSSQQLSHQQQHQQQQQQQQQQQKEMKNTNNIINKQSSPMQTPLPNSGLLALSSPPISPAYPPAPPANTASNTSNTATATQSSQKMKAKLHLPLEPLQIITNANNPSNGSSLNHFQRAAESAETLAGLLESAGHGTRHISTLHNAGPASAPVFMHANYPWHDSSSSSTSSQAPSPPSTPLTLQRPPASASVNGSFPQMLPLSAIYGPTHSFHLQHPHHHQQQQQQLKKYTAPHDILGASLTHMPEEEEEEEESVIFLPENSAEEKDVTAEDSDSMDEVSEESEEEDEEEEEEEGKDRVVGLSMSLPSSNFFFQTNNNNTTTSSTNNNNTVATTVGKQRRGSISSPPSQPQKQPLRGRSLSTSSTPLSQTTPTTLFKARRSSLSTPNTTATTASKKKKEPLPPIPTPTLSPSAAALLAASKTLTSPTTGKKSFACPFPGCPRTFPRQYNLTSHIYCHTGERPHSCPHCHAAFARKHDLRRHLRTLHAEDRPFKCERCAQSFTNADQLRRHMAAEDQQEAAKREAVKVGLYVYPKEGEVERATVIGLRRASIQGLGMLSGLQQQAAAGQR